MICKLRTADRRSFQVISVVVKDLGLFMEIPKICMWIGYQQNIPAGIIIIADLYGNMFGLILIVSIFF